MMRRGRAATMLAAAMLCASIACAQTRGEQHGLAVEHDTTSMLSARRFATLAPEARAAWTAYVAKSRELQAADRALIAAELQAAGMRQMVKAPFIRAFNVTRSMTPDWFRGDSARRLADVMLTYQTPSGGWSKHVDFTQHARKPGESFYAESDGWQYIATLDNDATTAEIRFLVLADAAKPEARYRDAAAKGLQYLLVSQYPTGCWPQVYPLQGGYHDAATYNDDATLNALRLLQDASSGAFSWVSGDVRLRAAAAVSRGIDCVIGSQVVVDGTRTVWGQQHDPVSLAPVAARSYELTSLTSKESATLMEWLMTLAAPDERVVRAVYGAADWFRAVAIRDIAYDFENGLRAAPGGGPLWARMYEIGTNRPIFSNRDGVRLYDWNQLTDRRHGYGWYDDEPARVLKKFDVWSMKHPRPATNH
jgi:PelA/Pel-15E family pectate lyase